MRTLAWNKPAPRPSVALARTPAIPRSGIAKRPRQRSPLSGITLIAEPGGMKSLSVFVPSRVRGRVSSLLTSRKKLAPCAFCRSPGAAPTGWERSRSARRGRPPPNSSRVPRPAVPYAMRRSPDKPRIVFPSQENTHVAGSCGPRTQEQLATARAFFTTGGIVGSRRQLGDRQDLMPEARQRTDNSVVATLVGKKTQHRHLSGDYAGAVERTSS